MILQIESYVVPWCSRVWPCSRKIYGNSKKRSSTNYTVKGHHHLINSPSCWRSVVSASFFGDIWTFRIEMARFLLAFSCVLLFITLFNVLLPVYATSKGNPHPFHSDRWRSAAIFTGRSFSFPLCFENNNNNSKGTPNSNAALQLWREIQSPSVHRSSLRRATSFKRCVSSTSILFPFLMIY